jgi:hypothetical protein
MSATVLDSATASTSCPTRNGSTAGCSAKAKTEESADADLSGALDSGFSGGYSEFDDNFSPMETADGASGENNQGTSVGFAQASGTSAKTPGPGEHTSKAASKRGREQAVGSPQAVGAALQAPVVHSDVTSPSTHVPPPKRQACIETPGSPVKTPEAADVDKVTKSRSLLSSSDDETPGSPVKTPEAADVDKVTKSRSLLSSSDDLDATSSPPRFEGSAAKDANDVGPCPDVERKDDKELSARPNASSADASIGVDSTTDRTNHGTNAEGQAGESIGPKARVRFFGMCAKCGGCDYFPPVKFQTIKESLEGLLDLIVETSLLADAALQLGVRHNFRFEHIHFQESTIEMPNEPCKQIAANISLCLATHYHEWSLNRERIVQCFPREDIIVETLRNSPSWFSSVFVDSVREEGGGELEEDFLEVAEVTPEAAVLSIHGALKNLVCLVKDTVGRISGIKPVDYFYDIDEVKEEVQKVRFDDRSEAEKFAVDVSNLIAIKRNQVLRFRKQEFRVYIEKKLAIGVAASRLNDVYAENVDIIRDAAFQDSDSELSSGDSEHGDFVGLTSSDFPDNAQESGTWKCLELTLGELSDQRSLLSMILRIVSVAVDDQQSSLLMKILLRALAAVHDSDKLLFDSILTRVLAEVTFQVPALSDKLLGLFSAEISTLEHRRKLYDADCKDRTAHNSFLDTEALEHESDSEEDIDANEESLKDAGIYNCKDVVDMKIPTYSIPEHLKDRIAELQDQEVLMNMDTEAFVLGNNSNGSYELLHTEAFHFRTVSPDVIKKARKSSRDRSLNKCLRHSNKYSFTLMDLTLPYKGKITGVPSSRKGRMGGKVLEAYEVTLDYGGTCHVDTQLAYAARDAAKEAYTKDLTTAATKVTAAATAATAAARRGAAVGGSEGKRLSHCDSESETELDDEKAAGGDQVTELAYTDDTINDCATAASGVVAAAAAGGAAGGGGLRHNGDIKWDIERLIDSDGDEIIFESTSVDVNKALKWTADANPTRSAKKQQRSKKK